VRVWRFSLYYFLVFGGYVALSLWLPKYYIDVYGFDLKTAALLTAIFVFPSGIIRAPGGWLSDRFGARTVMYWVLGTCVLTSFVLMFPDVRLAFAVPAKYAAGSTTMHLSLQIGPGLFTGLVFVLGIAMGIGKAAVYKHIPHYFPDRVGAVGGLVGVIGGLGGFVMPILFGALAQRTRLPTTTFMFLFAVSLASLVWMIVVIHQLTRQAAPRVAEDLETGELLAVAGAEMAAGGELVFAEHLRLWQERRRAAVAAGSE
jgi:NNP family nitrate/nitrite transporter-like MFS transporter